MVEIEEVQEVKKVSPIKSEATAAKDRGNGAGKEQYIETEEPTEYGASSDSKEDSKKTRVVSSDTSNTDLNVGDVFYGSANYNNKKGKNIRQQGIFLVMDVRVKGKSGQSREYTLQNICGEIFNACSGGIKLHNTTEQKRKQIEEKSDDAFGKKDKEQIEKELDEKKKAKELAKIQYDFSSLSPQTKLFNLIKAGMNNIWMVGPAGCGKSTIARDTAKELEIPYLCISCGIGTSATEFTGYKYPTREATKFSEYYAKRSVILIDEMTALDPAVAQVINAALANGEIETTTGTVKRHEECIIIATSNTFGGGADRQYVANNQLDASTIDRFIGGIIEVNYSEEYESQFDTEVVNYIKGLRNCIKINSLRRIASTRMIQAACKMKDSGMRDWKQLLIINWSDTEKKIVEEYFFSASTDKLKSVFEKYKAIHPTYNTLKSA